VSYSLAGLPSRVCIYEVGPRDGLQNESASVPVEVKLQFIQRLVAAGLRTVEATSFVHPRWVPQLADAEQLMHSLPRADGVRYPVLVPNERGLERALGLGVRDIAVFGSATETFAQRNLNRSLDSQFEMFTPVVARAVAAGVQVRGYVSMCFGDPWEGPVAVNQVVRVGQRLLDLGCAELSLGDTIGVATPAGSAAARTPRARRATSPPRTSCGSCTDWASRPGSTSTRWWRRVCGWQQNSVGPVPRGWSRPSAKERKRCWTTGSTTS